MRRFTKRDVLNAVTNARANNPKNDPNITIYILCDVKFPTIPKTHRINAVKELESVAVPCAVVLACNSDELAVEAVEFISKREGMFYYGAYRNMPTARFFHRDEIARMSLKEVLRTNPARFDLPDFENIAQAIHATRSLQGDYVEIGTFTGSSAYFALNYMERGGGGGIRRRSYFLDTFEGFDYESAASSADGLWHKSHMDTSCEAVKKLLSRFTVPHQVVRSNIVTDMLPAEIKQITVCNIDVDLYEAISVALVKVAPLVVEGGIIIVEDQGHTPLLIGAYAAVKHFLASPAGKIFVPVELISGQVFLIKTRNSIH
jgi:hypothetical protein